MGVVIAIVVLLVIGLVIMWVSDGVWNTAGWAGRAVRRGFSGREARRPGVISFRTQAPPAFLRDAVMRQVPAAPQPGVVVGLHLSDVSPQSITYSYGDVMSTSFCAAFSLEPDYAGARGTFAITHWTECGGDVKDTAAMNELSRRVDECIRRIDPAAQLEHLRG